MEGTLYWSRIRDQADKVKGSKQVDRMLTANISDPENFRKHWFVLNDVVLANYKVSVRG